MPLTSVVHPASANNIPMEVPFNVYKMVKMIESEYKLIGLMSK